MRFRELAPKVRRERIRVAVDGVLRQADVPVSTGELVKLVTQFLDAKDDQDWIARFIVDLAKEHENARQTGDTFVKYGRTMRRWEWLPLHTAHRPTAQELQRRREKIAAQEAAEDWTVHPEPPEDEEFIG